MSASLLSQAVISVRDTQLVLLPSRMIWWPERRALVFADSHFGKASTFRQAGVPIPLGTTRAMLERITIEVKRLVADQLIIAGDFVHSSTSAKEDFEDELRLWRLGHPTLAITLVRGNHDVRGSQFYAELGIELAPTSILKLGAIRVSHFPEDAGDGEFLICGHTHPAIRLSDGIASEVLSCFVLSRNSLVLPAFGEFTGRASHVRKQGETIYAIAGDKIIEVPSPRRGGLIR